MDKRIEVVELKVSELRLDFGNPRKIKKANKDALKKSFDDFGDFGLILINEDNQVIGGNQRVTILREQNPDTMVLCKRLIGYSQAELRVINIRANQHAGEWDLDQLADWTADLNIDLGIKEVETPLEERTIKDMELIHYEKYNYVMICCRSELDYNDLVRKLGIEGKQVSIAKRKIAARAIWYDKMNAVIIPKEEQEEEQ